MMVTFASTVAMPATKMVEESDFASRVRSARKILGLSQKGLSDRSNIPISTLKNYELGHSSPSAENLQRLHAAGINPMWILLGQRPILNRSMKASVARIAAAKSAAKLATTRGKAGHSPKSRGKRSLKSSDGNPVQATTPGAIASEKESL